MAGSIIIPLSGRSGGESILSPLDSPVVTIVSQDANELVLTWNSVPNAVSYSYDLADDISFNNILFSDTQNVLTVTFNAATIDRPFLTDSAFKIKAVADPLTHLDSADAITLFSFAPQQPLETAAVILNPGDAEVGILWNITDTTGVLEYRIYKSLDVVPQVFNLLHTEPVQGVLSFTDANLINDDQYFYKVEVVPVDYRYRGSESPVYSATPTSAATPQLTPPTNLLITIQGNDPQEILLSWTNPPDANHYDIYSDGNLVQAGVTDSFFPFSGLTLNQTYTLGVVAGDTGGSYLDSNQATINYTPIAVDNTATIPEDSQYAGGANPYMKPLDGRLEFSVNFPLINTVPYTYDNTIVDGSGITASDYYDGTLGTNGLCKIESTLPNTFTNKDLNMRFCGLYINENSKILNYNRVDEFSPSGEASVYSSVVYVDPAGAYILVDHEYNGSNKAQPQPTTNSKGYIFFDNSDALNAAFVAHFASTRVNFVFQPLGFNSNYEITCYVAPRFNQLDESTSATDTLIHTNSMLSARVKIRLEDYYYIENALGTTIQDPGNAIVNLGGGDKDFVSHNIQWTTPHRWLVAGDTKKIELAENARNRVGITLFNNVNNRAEYDTISNGVGITKEFFVFGPGVAGKGGTTISNAIPSLVDTDKFHYQYFNKCDFRGLDAGGANVGNGADFVIFDDSKIDFNPQNKYASTFNLARIKITNDYTPFSAEVQARDYYPPVAEVASSSDANFAAVNAQGSNLAWHMLQIKRDTYGQGGTWDNTPLLFLWARQGGAMADMAHYEFMYRNQAEFNYWGTKSTRPMQPSASAIESLIDNTAFRAKAALLVQNIPEVGQKYVISRDWNVTLDSWNHKLNEGALIPELDEVFPRGICSNVNWGAVIRRNGVTVSPAIQKYAQGLNIKTSLDFDWANVIDGDIETGYAQYGNLDNLQASNVDFEAYYDVPENGRPMAFQMGDQFKITETGYDDTIIYTVTYHWVFTNGQPQASWAQNHVNSPTAKVNQTTPWFQHSNYNWHQFMTYELDKDLPSGLPLAFEIEMLTSKSEVLLDGVDREAIITYKGTNTSIPNGGKARRSYGHRAGLIGVNNEGIPVTEFGHGAFPSDASGHVSYSHGDVSKFFRRTDFNWSFWRENNNGEPVTESFADFEGNNRTVRALSSETKGLTYIDCTEPPTGEIGRAAGGSTSSLCGFAWERARMIYEKYSYTPAWISEGIQFPPKMRTYGTPNVVNLTSPINPNYSVEVEATSDSAPDIPTPVRGKIESLIGSMLPPPAGTWSIGAITSSTIEIVLDPSIEGTNLDIQYSVNADFTDAVKVKDVIIGSTSALIPSLDEGTFYYIRLWSRRNNSVDGQDYSGPSDIKSATTTSGGIPIADASFTLTPGDTSLRVNYVPQTGMDTVTVFYKESTSPTFIENGTFPPLGQLDIFSLANGTSYDVQLRYNPTSGYLETFSQIETETPTI